jgi:YggT family protein
MWAVIARSLLSWFPVDQTSTAYQMLYRVTEPIIEPFRRFAPNTGMFDLSPLMAMMALMIMQILIGNLVQPA